MSSCPMSTSSSHAAAAPMHICDAPSESDAAAQITQTAPQTAQSHHEQQQQQQPDGCVHRRLATTLNNAGVLFSHLQNPDYALSRYQEALQVRMRLATTGGRVSPYDDELAVLSERYDETKVEVAELSRTYREHRKTEVPNLDLYPMSGLEETAPDLSADSAAQGEDEQHAPMPPLLIPASSSAAAHETLSRQEDSRNVAMTLFNIGLLHQQQNSEDGINEAIRFFDMALNNLDKSDPQDSFLMAIVLNACAKVEYKRGEYESSMNLLRDALKCHQVLARSPATKFETYTADKIISHESVLADKFSLMGRIHFSLGNGEESMDLSLEALQLRRKTRSDDGMAFACSLWNIGLVLALKNDVKGAITHLEEFVHVCGKEQDGEQEQGNLSTHVATAHHTIGLLHLKNVQVASALTSFTSALTVRKAALGPDDPSVAASYFKLATVMNQTGRYQESLKLCHEALRIQRANFGPVSRETGSILCLVGSIHQDVGEFDRALALYEETLQIAKAVVGYETEFCANMLEAIGNLHLYQGQSQGAIEKFTESARIRRNLNSDLEEGETSSSSTADEAIKALMKSYPSAAAA